MLINPAKNLSQSQRIAMIERQPKVVTFGRYVSFKSEIEESTSSLRNADELLQNIEIAENHLKAGDKIIFNFEETEQITIEALAYLLGNIEMFIHQYGNKINGTYSRYEGVNQLLRDSGFLRHLNFPNKSTSDSPHDDELVHLTFRSSHFLNPAAIAPLRREVTNNNIIISKVYEKKIFRALSEAMLNVHHHAYSGVKYKLPRNLHAKGRWWLGAQYDKSSGELSFAMYDVGGGIPSTMPRNYDGAYLMNFASDPDRCTDADLIYAATRPGKTSTKKRHRGRGLPDMHQIVADGRGELRIYSGHGRYYFDRVSADRRTMKRSCVGTLVLWTIDTETL